LSLLLRGVLLIGFGNGAVVWAEQTVPSGLAAVLWLFFYFAIGFGWLEL